MLFPFLPKPLSPYPSTLRNDAPGLHSRGNDLQRRPWTHWNITYMANLNDISDLFDFSRYYEGYEVESNSTEASSPAPSLPTLRADSPLSESSSFSTLSDSTAPSSPPLTEEEDAHYNNLIYHAVDSPVLPSTPPTHMAEMSLTLVPPPPPFALPMPVPKASIPSTTSATPSPRTSFSASVSPPVLKRRRSLTAESMESQPGPSTSKPRPAKQPRLSVPGETAFQLDVQVPAFNSSSPSGLPMGRTRQRVDYSACKCRNRTSKPARHWKTACPYNPNRHQNRVSCDLCNMTFTRHDNMDRHMEDYH